MNVPHFFGIQNLESCVSMKPSKQKYIIENSGYVPFGEMNLGVYSKHKLDRKTFQMKELKHL